MTSPTAPAPFTRAQALAYLLGIHCPSCSAVLSGPGLPCESCGKIPPVTAPKAEQMLDSATAIAAVQQKVLEAEAEALYQAAMEKWQDAAQAVHLALLQDQRDAAQKAVDEHKRSHKRLLAPLARAERAEDAAATSLSEVAARYDEALAAEELARRMQHGYDAEKQALEALEKATTIRDRYQGYLADASTERAKEEKPVTASTARGDQLRKALADAKDALANPGTAPLGEAAIIASPWRLLQAGKLDDAGMEIAAEVGRAICDATGATDEIAAEARGQLLGEQEGAARAQPLIRRADGVVMGNPLNPATPQPFHPPGRDAQPSPYSPAIAPGWG